MFNKERLLYEARIETFKRYITGLFYPESVALKAEFCKFSPMVSFSDKEKGNYQPASIGLQWGSNWEKAWFSLEGKVPDNWKGKTVCAKLDIGSEALIFNDAGKALQAISVHSVWDPGFVRDRYELFEVANGGENVKLWLEAAANQYFGLQLVRDPEPNAPNPNGVHLPTVKELNLVTFRKNVWNLYQDIELLAGLLHTLPEDSVRRSRILKALMQGIDSFSPSDQGVEVFRELLKPVLQNKNGDTTLKTIAVGHAHLDTAWLWSIEETIHKCARTFANQLNLLDKYPDYKFGASMAQHYQFMKDHYPEIYKRIKKAIEKGQWEVQGGMWVEADCNLISGESMIRQILYGKQFAEEEFNLDINNLWLPDVFGYSAAMPQILKKSGIDYMVTQKISWNQFNKFPHHSFKWRGIDGTEVLVHFPPEDNYNSTLEPKSLKYATDNFVEKGVMDQFLTLFGIGNGGGGPTEEMIERGIRQKNLEGSSKVEFGKSTEFLNHLEEKSDELRTWVGELYLELHRGTYTSQAYNKLMNRLMETKLGRLETLYSCLDLKEYPAEEIKELWKTVLLYQFHDIIPGSSIAKVYDKSREVYSNLETDIKLLEEGIFSKQVKSDDNKFLLINTSSSHYEGRIELKELQENACLLDSDGNFLPVQKAYGCNLVEISIDPMSVCEYEVVQKIIPENKIDDKLILENDFVKYEFSDEGWLLSAYDKEYNRDIMLDSKPGNQLCLFEDRPVDWDAWDIDIYYENQLLEIGKSFNCKRIVGSVESTLIFEYKISKSAISQEVTLGNLNKRIDFKTRINWNERHKMLRVRFDVDVNATEAAFEIQSGYVFRPTHRNTQWDFARFETVGHRFADLSEPDYGVALLNNCKYGYKVLGNSMEINLLRSPTNPDPFADIGEHNFIYSLLPHKGNLINSNVFDHASMINLQPVGEFGRLKSELSFPVNLDSYKHIRIDALKIAESGKGIIVRCIEYKGVRAKVKLSISSNYKNIEEVNLMEKNPVKLDLLDGTVELKFSPFEIKTFLIY